MPYTTFSSSIFFIISTKMDLKGEKEYKKKGLTPFKTGKFILKNRIFLLFG